MCVELVVGRGLGPTQKFCVHIDVQVEEGAAGICGSTSTGKLLYPAASCDCDGTKLS